MGGPRAILNRYPIPIGISVIVIAALCIFRAAYNHPAPEKRYFTVDDGATFFPLTVRVPPFDYGGKEAVGAAIYSCDGGKTLFVGYLYRYTPEGKATMEDMIKHHRGGGVSGMEVKRPGPGKWTSAVRHGPPEPGEDGSSITNVKCPDGNSTPMMMNP